jgi:acetyl esterase/lipase
VVSINYRLSPGVKHPEHVRDVARAFAWTHAHIGEYGGNKEQIFVSGHSAGGHLASLLATDATYLKAHGLSAKDIRGVIPVSGVYVIPDVGVRLARGSETTQTMVDLAQVAPFLPEVRLSLTLPRVLGRNNGREHELAVGLFAPVFGTDPQVLKDASPLTHVRPGLPPFLISYAEEEFPLLPQQAEDFHKALREAGVESQLVVVEDRKHHDIVFQATTAKDPLARAVLEFVDTHTRK